VKKSGVVGINGSGKFDVDADYGPVRTKGFSGESMGREGAKVGYLEQEPYLDPALGPCAENVMGRSKKEKKDIGSLITNWR